MSKKFEFVGEVLAVELTEQEQAHVVGGVVVSTMIQKECENEGQKIKSCGERDSERVG